MSDTQTDIETRIAILADLFIEYKGSEQFEDFFDYNDIGLPLAYALNAGIVNRTTQADDFVNETFDLLIDAIGHKEDTGFETISDVVGL